MTKIFIVTFFSWQVKNLWMILFLQLAYDRALLQQTCCPVCVLTDLSDPMQMCKGELSHWMCLSQLLCHFWVQCLPSSKQK